MVSTRLAPPIFGVVARTLEARRLLDPITLYRWVEPWSLQPDPADWWIEPSAGVAIFRPEAVGDIEIPGGQAALAVRGSIVALGDQARPRPGEEGTTALLRDLVARESAAVEEMRGQFAVAVWDPVRRCLFFARDQLGHRGFFFRTEPELIVFCSELSPLLRGGGTGCRLDAESAISYLAIGMCPPGRTLAVDVTRLPAAHLAVWRPWTSLFVRRYWTPLAASAPAEASRETVEAIREVLGRSVALRLDAERPTGVLLSGGLDSTFMAATARAIYPDSPVTAFTAGFPEVHDIDETPWAEAVADWLGLEHDVVETPTSAALDFLRSVVLSAAEPCAAWAAVTHFALMARAQQKGTEVVLSGLGADEIFGGYDQFRGLYSRYLRHARRVDVALNADAFASALCIEEQAYRRLLFAGIARFFDDPALRRALHEPYCRWHHAPHVRAFYHECRRLKPEAHVMEMMIAHECQHRIPDMLHAGFEPISRRLGIQVEYPFLDPDVVQLVAGLSPKSRYRSRSGVFSIRLRDLDPRYKHIMLQVAEDRVPLEIRRRIRKSLTAPFGHWLLKEEFGPAVLEGLARSAFWGCGLVKREWLDTILDSVGPRPSPSLMQLWALVTLAAWYDRFVTGSPETS